MLCRRPGLVAERGANMLEYVGITIVVAGVIVALAMTTVPSDIQAGFANGVCRIINPGDPDCEDGGPATASPNPDASSETPGPGSSSGAPTDAPTTEPTDDPNTDDPGTGDSDTGTDPGSDAYNTAVDEAEQAAQDEKDAEAEWGEIDKELLDLVAELVGWNSAKDCFTKGDIGACLETLLTAIPWGKLFKAAKMIPKIWKLFRRFQKLWEKVKAARKARKKADDTLAEVAKTCKLPGNSFTPDTPVLLADGTTRAIGSIRTGDRVLATDPATGLTQTRAVTHLIPGYGAKRLVDVAVRPAGRATGPSGTLTATEGHPFWVRSRQRWVKAGDLAPGDRLRGANGEVRQVAAVRPHTETVRVRNLTVAGSHTYYVMAGGQSVLVHNDKKKFCFPPPKLDSTGKVHGDLPNRVPDNWTRDKLEELQADLQKSIKRRKDEQLDLGEDGPHRERIRQEEQLLRQIEKKLSGS